MHTISGMFQFQNKKLPRIGHLHMAEPGIWGTGAMLPNLVLNLKFVPVPLESPGALNKEKLNWGVINKQQMVYI